MEKILATPLGEILVRRGTISQGQLDEALALQQRRGGRLGDVIIGQRFIGYYSLYQAVAEHYRLPFVDLLQELPEPDLLLQPAAETYLRLRAIPWRRNTTGITIAVAEMSGETMTWIRRHYGENVQLVVTSPFDIRRTVETHFGDMFEKKSCLLLWQRNPKASARATITARQKQIFSGFLLCLIALFALSPLTGMLTFIGICYIAFGASMVFKFFIFTRGITPQPAPDWKTCLASLDERELPVYTVLLPMYRETKSLPGLLASMEALDYPSHKLDIKLVLEADDRQTMKVAEALHPSYRFEIIRVPAGKLRTKPKACNYALRFAYGEYVTIFDADDRPEATQLKKAVYSFRNLPSDVACLQARLQYYNINDNMLTRFFSLEYTMLFHHMLAGLQRIGIPIPLGGTSNHIALGKLKNVGEWDPYNVAEDADLGIRLATRGFRTVMLDSYTEEEATNTLPQWIAQRSRWIKGYMQTWLVHMRQAPALYRTLGLKGFIGFQFFIGVPAFVALSAPLVWLLTGLWIVHLLAAGNIAFPVWLAWLTGIDLTLNMFTHWYMAFNCARTYPRFRQQLYIAAALYPFYMLLHSVASYKALYQLVVKPHFWEKTEHGLGKQVPALAIVRQA